MRAYQGQMSDNQPIKRTQTEKRKLLTELEETLRSMKPTVAANHRATISARIAQLRAETAGA